MSMYNNSARQAFAAGIATGARRAGVTDAKVITSLQSDLDGKYWDDFAQEASPTPTEARQLGGDFVQHWIDHLAGRNTDAKLATLRQASWQNERGRQRSNQATDQKFVAVDAWAKTELPKLYERLQHGVGNRPSVARFLTDKHTDYVSRVRALQASDPQAGPENLMASK
jgi:hypothetical protein